MWSCNIDEKMLTIIHQDLIRISVGIEHIDDIIADFEQSFKTSATKPEQKGDPEAAKNEGDAGAPTKPVV